MSWTPVLKNVRPSDTGGTVLVLAYLTTASTPSDAISSGNCIAVAPSLPSAMAWTPAQPPSTDTSTTLSWTPALVSAVYAPAAVGSLMVWTTVMPGSLDNRFSIAVSPPASWPLLTSWPTMRGSVSSPMTVLSATSTPNPDRKPWSRCTSTEAWVGESSMSAILAVVAASPSVPLAHSPMSVPASKLSVANVACAASGGFSGVSSAMTSSPASSAAFRAGTTASPLAVIKMPLAPAETAFSTAAIWESTSAEDVPAA